MAAVLAIQTDSLTAGLVNGNGDFEDSRNGGLFGWNRTPVEELLMVVVEPDGTNHYAKLYQGFADEPSIKLYQDFIRGTNEDILTFQAEMITPGSPGGDTDYFTVTLAGVELYKASSDPSWSTSFHSSYIGSTGNNHSFDLSSLMNGELAFTLSHDYGDGAASWAVIDNIVTSTQATIVPAPAALLLGCIGAGLVGLARRMKKL